MKKKFNKKKQTRAGEKAEKKRSKELDGEYSSVKSLSSSDKKLIAVVAVLIIVCAAVWAKSGIFGGGDKDNEPQTVKETEKTETVVSPEPPQSIPTETTVTQPTQNNNENESEDVSQNENSPSDELQSAIDAACAAVNKAKRTENFSATKDQEIKLSLTECNIPGVAKLANPILERYGKRRTIDFTFENGVGYDETYEKEVTPNEALPPTDKDFVLDKNGIASYEITKNGENTRYVFHFVEEKTTLENPVPQYHAMAMDYLDMSSVDIAPAKVTQADFDYTGAIVTVEVDPSGTLTYFEEYMPMHSTGAGKLGLTASGTMEGYIDEIWTFRW